MDDHTRTIIHIDIDCFYAQVEMNKNPVLKDQPLGIQQKNIVVTSNYTAREYGVKKCMVISEAKKLCPNLVLVNGEDLYDYRHVSSQVTELLKDYSVLVERLGLDENFVDVTDLVNKTGDADLKLTGCKFGDGNSMDCDCGCQERLTIGTMIAQQIRDEIFKKLQLTTCAGIAHNKLLAKIVGSQNKPNNQTVIFPNSASELMLSLDEVKNIPWIGRVTAELLEKININIVADLQNCEPNQLEAIFNQEKAKQLLDLSYGIDKSCVKVQGKPQSIGLEDACKPLTSQENVEAKFRELLKRLLVLIHEDGRIPKVLKISVRKSDSPGMLRETRQCAINISMIKEDQLVQVAMGLFWKIINKKSNFKVNLLGLSFAKFVEKPSSSNTLNAFLAGPKMNKSNEEEPPLKKARLSAIRENEPSGSKQDESILCPPNVDKDVFKELPIEVQEEIWNDYKSRDKIKKTGKNNCILNYMIRQPKK